jgi:hypothetical protein
MDIDKLMNQIETYYGNYENAKLKAFVKAYLLKDYKEGKFDEILKAILYYHKAAFKAPCIATIEECIKLARLEKGQVDPHKSKTTNTDRYNFKDSKDPAFDKVNVDLKGMLKNAVKTVD